MFVDTHCHLDSPEYDSDRQVLLEHLKDDGVDWIVSVGASIVNSQASVELAKRFDNVYASIGVHPHDADNIAPGQEEILRALARCAKVVAIGEIGLDYYKNYSSKENQRPLFESLARLGLELGLPLIIHCRQAETDTLSVLKELMPVRAVIHCFSGDSDFLKSCLDMGFFVSFTCNITYKKAQALRDAAKMAPMERIMLETDAPYLSPEGSRGKRNFPANVRFVAAELARIKQMDISEVAAATTRNANDFFGVK